MSFAYRISSYNRNRKWKVFQRIFSVTKKTKILDIGFSDKEYSETDNFLEKHYPYRAQITALGIDEPKEFTKRYQDVRAVQYDGKKFPFQNKVFDIAWSNAVLEHVGSTADQVLFLQEIARVASAAFITTPNRHFPIEVHTRIPLLHWLPKNFFDRILHILGKSWATGSYMNLLSEREIRGLLKKAGIANYKILRNRLLFFTLDFVIVIRN